MLKAIKDGNLEKVNILMSKKNFDINKIYKNQDTALIEASRMCQVEMARLFILNDADIDMSNRDGYTALIEASNVGCLEIVEILLELDVNINDQDRYRRTALNVAARNGYFEIVLKLIEAGSDISMSGIDEAAYHGHFNIVQLLLQGVDVNIIDQDSGSNLLIKACLNNNNDDVRIIDVLVQAGIDINHQNLEGYTALHKAVEYKNIKFVSRLIQYGANVNFFNINGETPLFEACFNKNYDIISKLLNAGADVNYRNMQVQGKTVLMSCSGRGQLKIVTMLILAGADVFIKDNSDSTAWSYSNRNGHKKTTTLLDTVMLLDQLPQSSLDKLFKKDPYLWTGISKWYSTKVFFYFIERYSILLNLPRDIIQNIF